MFAGNITIKYFLYLNLIFYHKETSFLEENCFSTISGSSFESFLSIKTFQDNQNICSISVIYPLYLVKGVDFKTWFAITS